jgi:ABC-2 type transport system ATP-binding protein
MADLAVEAHGVWKRYGGHVAVRDLALKIPRGVVYGLLGPNGSGKTTTLRMLLRIIAPDEGTIRVLGEKPGVRLARRVGYLPEERGLYRKMTVERVLAYLGELRGLTHKDARAASARWLARVGLLEWRKNKVEDLSKGMQQKVQFVGALLHDPDLVILDEPWSGLDPINLEVLKEILVELRRAGRTILLSTHSLEQAEQICDGVCLIARSAVVLDGPLAQVRRRHGPPRVRLGIDEAAPLPPAAQALLDDPALVARRRAHGALEEIDLADAADPARLLAALVGAGARLTRFEVTTPSLREIYLEHVGGEATDGDAPQSALEAAAASRGSHE